MNYTQDTPLPKTVLSVALLSSEEGRLRALARAFQQQQATISYEVREESEVAVIDLHPDADAALDLVESLCARHPGLTVMVYARRPDPELLLRAMRAGARELLTEPLAAPAVAEAVIRASARRLEGEHPKKQTGAVLLFWGAKGGAGTTTLAANFAIALRQESGREVALLDLHFDLGDAAVALGLAPRFTLADALRSPERLDPDFVSTLLAEHASGLAVLAAPDQYTAPAAGRAVDSLAKLVGILRGRFRYVVVDAGTSPGLAAEAAVEAAETIYLVTQAEILGLRKTQRLLAHLRRNGGAERRIEVVINRFDPRRTMMDEADMSKALGAPLKWKVPNDFFAVRRSLDTGAPLALDHSPVARLLRQMAREACGKPPVAAARKSLWNL